MYAHITWHTWMRVGRVDGPAALEVRTAVASAGKKTGVQVLRGAVLADHVHLVVSFRPDTRLSDFVRLAKSVAATRANRRVVGAVKWARGYYVATIHKRDLARALRYVDRQFQRIPRSSGLTGPGRKPGEHPNSTGDLTDPGRKPGEHPNSTGDSLTPGASPG
jgi:putative transposase